MVAISMVAVVSAAALAIDVGRLVTARGESQRAGEAAALAGAGWLIAAPVDEVGARERAKEYALLNTVRGDPVVLLDEDIDVILDSAKVRVRVHNSSTRNTAIPTFFARVFGVRTVDIRTLAAAWAGPADELPLTSVDCPLPVAILDRWIDSNGNGQYDAGEYYDREGSGYTDGDVGKVIVAKVSGSENKGGPKQCRVPSQYVDIDACKDEPLSTNWRCWYREELPANGGGGGVDVLGPRIYPAESCGPGLAVGDPVYAASGSGNKQSLVGTVHPDFGGTGPGSFRDLIESDPDIYWDEPARCPKRPGSTACVENSPRIRSVPLLKPDGVHGTGSAVSSTIADFTGVFVDLVACNWGLPQFDGPKGNWNVYLRLMRAGAGAGGGGGSGGPAPGATTFKKLQLIE